jgi:hypothetical protein
MSDLRSVCNKVSRANIINQRVAARAMRALERLGADEFSPDSADRDQRRAAFLYDWLHRSYYLQVQA